jgi:hypothetical protein
VARLNIEQRHLTHRGRQFHFVLYEGIPANVARQVPATGPTWYLMSSGKRWAVMPCAPELSEDQLDRQLCDWLESHIFA